MSTIIAAGYGPLDEADEVGIEEALVMADVADQEYRVAAADVFRRIARIPEVDGVELLDGFHLAVD